MNTQIINTTEELTLEQLEDVNGGFLAALYAYAVDSTFGKACREAADTMNEATGNGVMAQEDGTDCTGYNPNNPMNPKF